MREIGIGAEKVSFKRFIKPQNSVSKPYAIPPKRFIEQNKPVFFFHGPSTNCFLFYTLEGYLKQAFFSFKNKLISTAASTPLQFQAI